jgi:hypothetical protein
LLLKNIVIGILGNLLRGYFYEVRKEKDYEG